MLFFPIYCRTTKICLFLIEFFENNKNKLLNLSKSSKNFVVRGHWHLLSGICRAVANLRIPTENKMLVSDDPANKKISKAQTQEVLYLRAINLRPLISERPERKCSHKEDIYHQCNQQERQELKQSGREIKTAQGSMSCSSSSLATVV